MSQSDQVSKGIWKFFGQFALVILLVVVFSCCGCTVMLASCQKKAEDILREADRMGDEDQARAEAARTAVPPQQ